MNLCSADAHRPLFSKGTIFANVSFKQGVAPYLVDGLKSDLFFEAINGFLNSSIDFYNSGRNEVAAIIVVLLG